MAWLQAHHLGIVEQLGLAENAQAVDHKLGVALGIHLHTEHLIKKYLKQRTRRPVSDYYSDELLEAVDEYVSFCRLLRSYVLSFPQMMCAPCNSAKNSSSTRSSMESVSGVMRLSCSS